MALFFFQEPKEDAAPEPEDGKVKRRKGKLVPSPYKAGRVGGS